MIPLSPLLPFLPSHENLKNAKNHVCCVFGVSHGCSCCFFLREISKNKSQVETQTNGHQNTHRSPRDSKRPRRRNQLDQDGSKRIFACATQQHLPSPEPLFSTVALQVLGEFTHLGPSELTKEISIFIGTSSSNRCHKHDLHSSPLRAFFAFAGLGRSFPVLVAAPRLALPSVCKNDTIVVSVERKPVRHHF